VADAGLKGLLSLIDSQRNGNAEVIGRLTGTAAVPDMRSFCRCRRARILF